jgi:hypothetical protein
MPPPLRVQSRCRGLQARTGVQGVILAVPVQEDLSLPVTVKL